LVNLVDYKSQIGLLNYVEKTFVVLLEEEIDENQIVAKRLISTKAPIALFDGPSFKRERNELTIFYFHYRRF
jgi:hypothetical protein